MAINLDGKAVKTLQLPTVNYGNTAIQIVSAQEGDANSRYLKVSLFDERGNISMAKYTNVLLNATLPDGTCQSYAGEIIQEEKVAICKIPSSMLSQLGKVVCDIQLLGSENGNPISLTSRSFYILVSKSQSNEDAIEGDDNYTILMQLVDNVNELVRDVQGVKSQFSNALVGIGIGGAVSMNDVSPISHLVKVELDGGNLPKDTPVSVTSHGKNFLYHNSKVTNIDYNGVRVVDNADGTFTASGSASSTGSSYNSLLRPNKSILGNEVYYVSPNGGSEDCKLTIEAFAVQEGGTRKKLATFEAKNGENGFIMDLTSIAYDELNIFIFTRKGTTANETFKPQIERGTVGTSWEEGVCNTVKTTIQDGATFDSISPNMFIRTDNDGVIVIAEYNRDINSKIDNLDDTAAAMQAAMQGQIDYINSAIRKEPVQNSIPLRKDGGQIEVGAPVDDGDAVDFHTFKNKSSNALKRVVNGGSVVIYDVERGSNVGMISYIDNMPKVNAEPSPTNPIDISGCSEITVIFSGGDGVAETASVNFGQDVYRGSFDWTTGILTLDTIKKHICTASESLIASATEKSYGNANEDDYRWYITLPDMKPEGLSSNQVSSNILSSHFKSISAGNTWGCKNGVSHDGNNNRIIIYYDQFRSSSSKNDFVKWLSDNQVSFTYPIEPVTIKLAPREIVALENPYSISAGACTVAVTYKRDINVVVNDIEAENEYAIKQIDDLYGEIHHLSDETSNALKKTVIGDVVEIADDSILVDNSISVVSKIDTHQSDGTPSDGGVVQIPSPSNIRKLSGVNSAELTRSGVNILDLSTIRYYNDGASLSVNGDAIRVTRSSRTAKNPIVYVVLGESYPYLGKTITVTAKAKSSSAAGLHFFGVGLVRDDNIMRTTGTSYSNEISNSSDMHNLRLTKTLPDVAPDGYPNLALLLYADAQKTTDGITQQIGDYVDFFDFSLECDGNVYKPFVRDKHYPVEFGQDVYGGSYDWQTGTLEIDTHEIKLTGISYSEYSKDTSLDYQGDWFVNEGFSGKDDNGNITHPCFVFQISHGLKNIPVVDSSRRREFICSHFVNTFPQYETEARSSSFKKNGFSAAPSQEISKFMYFKMSAEDMINNGYTADADGWRQYLKDQYAAGTPVQLVYKTLEHKVIQFEQNEICAIEGTSTFSCNIGNCTVVYKRDANRAVDGIQREIDAVNVDIDNIYREIEHVNETIQDNSDAARQAIQDYADRISGEIIDIEEDISEIRSENKFNPVPYHEYNGTYAYSIPILYLDGDISQMNKDNSVTLSYRYNGTKTGDTSSTKDKVGSCTLKWQGSSSVNYPKKNYTINFDSAFEAQSGWGEQNKYCLKANYIDFSHARNIVCANLWSQIVQDRIDRKKKLNSSYVDPREGAPNNGAVDGFPVLLVINGEYVGLYTFNIPKDGWMMGMGIEGSDTFNTEAIVCADPLVTDEEALKVVRLFSPTAKCDGSDFEIEYAPDDDNTEWIKNSINELIQACVDVAKVNEDGSSNRSNFETYLSEYIDIDSAIDYYIFICLIAGYDCMQKNFILETFDSKKWYFSAYDLDSTFGNYWKGWKYSPVNESPNFAQYAWATPKKDPDTGNTVYAQDGKPVLDESRYYVLMYLIYTFARAKLISRYKELRNGVMSEANVLTMFSNFMAKFPTALKNEEIRIWPKIPGTETNNLAQIMYYYTLRCKLLDDEISGLESKL